MGQLIGFEYELTLDNIISTLNYFHTMVMQGNILVGKYALKCLGVKDHGAETFT